MKLVTFRSPNETRDRVGVLTTAADAVIGLSAHGTLRNRLVRA